MRGRTLAIEPVTRIEGEARVVIILDDLGRARDVYYQVLELRGFEAFCRGRQVEEMPRISQSICGVCSVPHHMASAKAVDSLLGRKPPEAATRIRELVYYIYMIDDHLLHLTVMALPDLVAERASEVRGLADVFKKHPEVVKKLVHARTITTTAIKRICGRSIHIPIAIPGGVSRRLSREDVEFVDRSLKDLGEHLRYALELFKNIVERSQRLRDLMVNEDYTLKTYYMGLVSENGSLSFYDGVLRVVDHGGNEVEVFKPEEYTKNISELYEDWSYSKFPYLTKIGWRGFEEGSIVRVGPLARLNVCTKIPTSWASEEYKAMLDYFGRGKIVDNTFAYHWARLIENVYAYEMAESILREERDLLISGEILDLEGKPAYGGVGVVEAARGVLIHHYKADSDFLVTEVNVITPTAINNAAINAQLKKVISRKKGGSIGGEDLVELVDKFEVVIRAYDPCNSCATHVTGSRLIKVFVYDLRGNLLKVF